MRVDELRYAPPVVLWQEDDLPHCVIEVNQRCNLECFGCYKRKSALQKDLDQVRGEIDLMMASRNLSTLSFAGGEPLLYPELEELVAYVAEMDVRPVLVTNGTLLEESRLAALRAAGLKGVCLHVDRFQGRRPDTPEQESEAALNPLRERYVRLCAHRGLDVGLALTLYRDNLEELPDVIELGYREPAVRYMLLTGYSPVANLEPGEEAPPELERQRVDAEHVAEMMTRRWGAHPTMYLPSSHDEGAVRWLFFMVAVTVDGEGEPHSLHLTGRHRRGLGWLMALDRRRRGRFAFDELPTGFEVALMVLVAAFASLLPGAVLEALGFVARAAWNGNLKLFSAVFQQSPARRADGEYEICKHCPDATVRDGRIVPVCLADVLHPLE